MIDKGDKLPVTRQCNLLDLSRSGVYYTPVPLSAKDMELMRQIDEIHLAYPFYGSRKIRNELWAKGYDVGRDRVRRLMRRMGIEALYVKPRLSLAHPGHVKYPYLLRGLEITQANHVWAADITYIPMAKGFCYLVAIMDWASRMVLSWRLSNTLDSSFCVDALEEAIAKYGCPEIFNTDQGSQFTAEAFTERSPFKRHCNQHGRQGPLDGQRLYRTALEKRQVRGYLPEGLWFNGGGEERTCHLFHVLQRKTMAPKL